MSTDVSELLIARPKKVDNTFVCSIHQPFSIVLKNSQLVHIKTVNQDAQFIFLKNKSLYNYLYDLNSRIIETVKENCSNWFNTNMNPDLVDDYYTTTLVYDKTHGDLIKIKVVGEQQFHQDIVGSKLNLTLKASNLRFYKQKFVLETTIDTYEMGCDIIDFSSDSESEQASDDEEVAYPSAAELEEMRTDVLTKTSDTINKLDEELANVKKVHEEMKNASDPDEVIRLYDLYAGNI